MNIGILGSGNVAQAVGAGLIAAGHEVMVSSRDPESEKVRQWLGQVGLRGHADAFAEAAHFGDAILLAINPWTEIEQLLRSLDTADLAGKAVIDPSNNIEFGMLPKLAFTDHSMGEMVQRWLPNAHVVKTLTLIPAAMMVNPRLSHIPPIQWIAGDDQAAKEQVTDLLHDLGWSEVFDLGGITLSRLQEAIGLMVTGIVMQLSQTTGQ